MNKERKKGKGRELNGKDSCIKIFAVNINLFLNKLSDYAKYIENHSSLKYQLFQLQYIFWLNCILNNLIS